jgi:hypothetical protein
MTAPIQSGAVFLLIVLLAGCGAETVEISEGMVELYVPEEQFRAIKTGMTAEEVTTQIGTARKKEAVGNADVWTFGVWRGDKPSLWRFLFTSSPIKHATVLEGRIHFVRGRVVSVHIDESSALPLAPPKKDK